MVPDLDALLRGIDYTGRNILMPELSSPFARTQCLALLETVGILRDRVAHGHEALLDENEALRAGLRDARATMAAAETALEPDDERALLRQVDDQLERVYPEHHGQRTIPGLEHERLDLRALHVRLMQACCAGDAFDAPALAALRARLRALYTPTYGFTVAFTPVWAD
ncbi:MAG: hypothetical protein IT304_09085 [Dehalococcoidia bacterium]|nr:hypothetical protein [Dehalococcoidia bacterium]